MIEAPGNKVSRGAEAVRYWIVKLGGCKVPETTCKQYVSVRQQSRRMAASPDAHVSVPSRAKRAGVGIVQFGGRHWKPSSGESPSDQDFAIRK